MDTLYKGQTKGILFFLMLISLYGKFGLFFDDSILGPAYLLSSVTLLIITGKILYEPRIQIGTIILLLTSFGIYLSGNRDITIYYTQILLMIAFFTLVETSINKYDLWGLISIVVFEIIYSFPEIPFKGTFNNPIGFVCLLLCCIAMTLFLHSALKKSMWGLIVLIFIAICLSKSRIGIFTFILLLLYHFHSISQPFKCVIKKYKYLLILSVVLLMSTLFIIKYNSSNGRLLIWYVVSDLIQSKPLLGYGIGGFKQVYMAHQASVLSNFNNEYWKYLADNITHPFSEYLLIYTELGLIGILILLYICRCAYRYSNQYFKITLVLLVCGLVSYPFTYPCIWVLLGFSLAKGMPPQFQVYFKNSFVIKIGTLSFLFIWLIFLIADINCNYQWKRIANERTSENKFLKYHNLYESGILNKNPYFLFDYGTFLLNENRRSQGLDILIKASYLIKDYKLEISLGNAFDINGEYLQAEQHYLTASQMCPNKFTPLFYLFKLYRKHQVIEKATHIAHIINNKTIKINSPSINYIKSEVRRYLKNTLNDPQIPIVPRNKHAGWKATGFSVLST